MIGVGLGNTARRREAASARPARAAALASLEREQVGNAAGQNFGLSRARASNKLSISGELRNGTLLFFNQTNATTLLKPADILRLGFL
jgi:hypothetical protein